MKIRKWYTTGYIMHVFTYILSMCILRKGTTASTTATEIGNGIFFY